MEKFEDFFHPHFSVLKISVKNFTNKIQLYFFLSATLYPMSNHPSSIFTSHQILSLTLPVANKARGVSSSGGIGMLQCVWAT